MKDNNITSDCKKFLGIYPHNVLTNIVVGDPHFYNYMCERYGEHTVVDKLKELNWGRRNERT